MHTSTTHRQLDLPVSTTLSARSDPFRAIVSFGASDSARPRRTVRARVVVAWLAAGAISWAAVAGAWLALASLL